MAAPTKSPSGASAKPATKTPTNSAAKTPAKPQRNNLLILGLAAIAIAVVTSGISIFVYHASGDIYLDRSRPGFLPDKEEEKEPDKETYKFPDTGSVDKSTLSTYLKEFKALVSDLDALGDPYGPAPLSDESLGLPTPSE